MAKHHQTDIQPSYGGRLSRTLGVPMRRSCVSCGAEARSCACSAELRWREWFLLALSLLGWTVAVLAAVACFWNLLRVLP